MTDSKKPTKTESGPENNTRRSRRRFITGVTAGTAAGIGMAGGGKWVKPVIDSVVLPAHAQVSPGAVMTVRVTVSGNDFDSDGGVFGPGAHTIPNSDGDGASFDDLDLQFAVDIKPPQTQPVPVTLTLNTAGGEDVTGVNYNQQTNNAAVPDVAGQDQKTSFTGLNVNSDGGPTFRLNAMFEAPGLGAQEVLLIINS